MECEKFSCELGKLIIEGINPEFQSGNYEIAYYPGEKNIIQITFLVCEEGAA